MSRLLVRPAGGGCTSSSLDLELDICIVLNVILTYLLRPKTYEILGL